jgi:hypothetical protein
MEGRTLKIGEAYLKALNEKDLEKLESYLHPALKFKTPLAEVSNRNEFFSAIQRLFANMRT